MEKVDIIKEICKNQQFYGIPCYYEDAVFESIDGNLSKMNVNQVKEYIEQIRSLNKEKNYDLPCFDNEDFIVNIINNIDIDEIEKYMLNTKEYIMHHECDKNYVLLFRRAIPSDEPITENFWTTNFNEVFRGLSMEISGHQRIHSVINIATLDSLERHGVVVTDRGVTDGEVAIDPNKNFNSFLFRYKPWRENFELIDFLEKGGISRKELLTKLSKNRVEKMKQQGLPIKNSELDSMLVDENNEIEEDFYKTWE